LFGGDVNHAQRKKAEKVHILASLREEVAVKGKSIADLTAERNRLAEERATFYALANDLEHKVAELREESEQLATALATATGDVESLRRRVKELEVEEREAGPLRRRLREKSAEIESLQREMHRLRAEVVNQQRAAEIARRLTS
jgi:chromosome segregation ATPase